MNWLRRKVYHWNDAKLKRCEDLQKSSEHALQKCMKLLEIIETYPVQEYSPENYNIVIQQIQDIAREGLKSDE